jgi:hypothetical protein
MGHTGLSSNSVKSMSIGSSSAPYRDSAHLLVRMSRGAEDLLLLTQGFLSLFQKENPRGLQLSIGCPYTMVFCIGPERVSLNGSVLIKFIVHKIENLFGSDFEFCTFSLLVLHKDFVN